MPDWVTHIAVAYTLCTILGFKYREFNTANTVLVMVGAVIPDVVKVGIIADILGYGVWDYLWPIHLPVGSLIVAGMMSLLFQDKKKTLLFFTLGVATHYGLDLLLFNVSGGIALFYPFYWGQWQLDLVTTDSYYTTIIALVLALVVFLISRWKIKADSKKVSKD